MRQASALYYFFFNDTAPTEIYTLSLHDALPISRIFHFMSLGAISGVVLSFPAAFVFGPVAAGVLLVLSAVNFVAAGDRKSTRLNSSHANISYAVFCLKKKKLLFPC